jgi:hypothetical protein
MPTTTGAVIFIIVPFTDARVGADGRARARRFVVVVFVFVFVVVVAVALVRARIVVTIARVIAPSVDVSRQTRTRRTVARTDSRASSSSSSTRIPSDTARRLAASIRSSGTRASLLIHLIHLIIHRQTAPSI